MDQPTLSPQFLATLRTYAFKKIGVISQPPLSDQAAVLNCHRADLENQKSHGSKVWFLSKKFWTSRPFAV